MAFRRKRKSRGYKRRGFKKRVRSRARKPKRVRIGFRM